MKIKATTTKKYVLPNVKRSLKIPQPQQQAFFSVCGVFGVDHRMGNEAVGNGNRREEKDGTVGEEKCHGCWAPAHGPPPEMRQSGGKGYGVGAISRRGRIHPT